MGRGRGKHPRGMNAKTLTFPEEAAWLGPTSSTCTQTHAVGYEQGERDVHGQLQSFDLTGLTQQQCDTLQDKDL